MGREPILGKTVSEAEAVFRRSINDLEAIYITIGSCLTVFNDDFLRSNIYICTFEGVSL